MRPLTGVVALSASFMLGCDVEIRMPEAVRGSGVIKEETRAVGDFTELQVSNGLKVTIVIGPKEPVKLSGDDKLLPLIKTEVSDGRLHVGLAPDTSIQPRTELQVTVTSPNISFIGASGGSIVEGSKLKPTDLKVDVNGGSTVKATELTASSASLGASGGSIITLSGGVADLKVEMSGGSIVHASKLQADTVVVGGSGGSQAEVQAASGLEADLSGGSRVRVAGKPSTRKVNTSGGSEVSFQPP